MSLTPNLIVQHHFLYSRFIPTSSDTKANVINLDTPHEDPNIRGDAFKTLIVARLSYEANEKDLENEFGRFGPIERVSERARYAISGPITDSLDRSVSLLIPTKMT